MRSTIENITYDVIIHALIDMYVSDGNEKN